MAKIHFKLVLIATPAHGVSLLYRSQERRHPQGTAVAERLLLVIALARAHLAAEGPINENRVAKNDRQHE